MASEQRPDETENGRPDSTQTTEGPGRNLDRRRADLAASLAVKRPSRGNEEKGGNTGAAAGYSQALKLSSEFIAGVLLGAALGWLIDRLAGTSPWGMIVFLLLGFCAGVLNVVRSAGLAAKPSLSDGDEPSDRK